MVRVKLITLNDGYVEYATDEEKARIGNIYEAFEIYDEHMTDVRYKKQYALNLGNGVWFLPAECCEVVEEVTIQNDNEIKYTNKYLLVEDGSVDIDFIEDDLGITCIVYRQGANKPEWLYK